MDDSSYREFLRRADQARTVSALRAVADDALLQFPDSAETTLVRDTCAMYAQGILERYGQERERRAHYAEHGYGEHDAGGSARA